MHTYFRLVFLAPIALFFVGCSSADKIDTNSAEGAFKLASNYEKDERYEEAITYYAEVKNKYPYSNLAVDAELQIAEIEYKRENYVESESAYKIFKEFHPAHPKIDYVTYRLGMSAINQLPPTIDRDLKLITPAIEYFSEVIASHSKSPYVADSIKQKQKLLKMQAEKANYVAEYYFIREKWESALGRYEDLLRSHPNLGFDAKALFGATISAYNMKDVDKAKTYFKRLLSEHPNSRELALARKELADGF
jgi:outer membrane protein assembly factor BamD